MSTEVNKTNDDRMLKSFIEVERLLILPYFDELFYFSKDLDLQLSGADAITHYLEFGWQELRDPNENFSTHFYLSEHIDVFTSGMNPFVHYIRWGNAQGRKVAPSGWQPAIRTENNPKRNIDDPDIELQRANFDFDFYLGASPDLKDYDGDLLMHFIEFGWRELRNPSQLFSVEYYLQNNSDVRSGGANPFLHYLKYGRYEGRKPASYENLLSRLDFHPLVSVIVPNFNHARFLETRLDSIIRQTYKNIELIILDDCSTDDSIETINSIVERSLIKEKIKLIRNESNSGGVFYQWERGINEAAGDLIWICESDDYSEIDFLEHIISSFKDQSIQICFGRVQFCDEDGTFREGLDYYRNNAEPGIWERYVTRTAKQWFTGSFATANLIPNVGGCVFRKQKLAADDWEIARQFRILGDWFLYIIWANGGRLKYIPQAVTYFRQHGKNTSVTGFRRKEYYVEHHLIGKVLRDQWGTSEDRIAKLITNVFEQYRISEASSVLGDVSKLVSLDEILATKKTTKHILVCSLGFSLGGGEIFPIHLANELVTRGYIVSMMVADSLDCEIEVRKMLDTRISVYDIQQVEEIGVSDFLEAAGIDLIHSHSVAIEFFFFSKHNLFIDMPYVVTLHGSYEVTPRSEQLMFRLLHNVDIWFYLADKNIKDFQLLPLDTSIFKRIPNGMPIDERPFHLTRSDLGISSETYVFTIVSRAIKEKGWRIAAHAVNVMRKQGYDVALILCGSGPDEDVINEMFSSADGVYVLGFQDRVHGIYGLSDCAILPTRFPGESFPLSLIQAMQVGLPIIATDIGEISKMISGAAGKAGLLLPNTHDDGEFSVSLAAAMIEIMQPGISDLFAKVSRRIGATYSIGSITEVYVNEYERLLSRDNS